jgi:hypothetical protein
MWQTTQYRMKNGAICKDSRASATGYMQLVTEQLNIFNINYTCSQTNAFWNVWIFMYMQIWFTIFITEVFQQDQHLLQEYNFPQIA